MRKPASEKWYQKYEIDQKLSKNGSRNRSQIHKIPEKKHAEINAKIWYRKKCRPASESIDFGHLFGQAGGKGVGKYKQILADLRVVWSRSAP